MKEGDFPTTANCDPNDPEECFLPYLVGLPGMKGASMMLPVKYLRLWSKRLWDGGARLAEEPVIFYHPPRFGDLNPMFAAGQWKDEPPPPAQEPPEMSLAMKQALIRKWEADAAAAAPEEVKE